MEINGKKVVDAKAPRSNRDQAKGRCSLIQTGIAIASQGKGITMFRIAFMAEDRKLADVLRSVAGQVHNLEVVPVVIGDAVTKVDISRAPKLQRMTKRVKTGGHNSARRDLSPTAVGLKKGQTFTYKDLMPLMTKMGMSEKSTWYVTMRMLREKTIRRIATGKYEVIS